MDSNDSPGGVDPRFRTWAVLLSVIDFFLSFLAISVIGFVLALFPYFNRLNRAQATPVVLVSVMPARDESAELAAVIAAAIYAMLGERHIVHIGEARPAPGWTLEYRALVHTSHAPRGSRRGEQRVEQLGDDRTVVPEVSPGRHTGDPPSRPRRTTLSSEHKAHYDKPAEGLGE